MSSTYSNLGIELIGTGEQSGTWGTTTNNNLGILLEQAISGYVTQAVSTGTDTTITIPNGASGVARNMYLELTGTGGANTNLIVPANKKLFLVFNNTSSGAVTVKVAALLVRLPEVAVMVDVPVARAVASPEELMVATLVVVEDQVAVLVRFCVLASV